MRHAFILWIICLIAFVAGCGTTVSGDEVVGAKINRETPHAEAAVVAKLANDNNAFAFDLYRMLRSEKGNLVYSPYSISSALAMTYAGARGETQQQMAKALHFSLSQQELHPAFNTLNQDLDKRDTSANYRLDIANALWGQKGHQFLPQFISSINKNYGAGLHVVDFKQNTEGARKTINTWVDEKTKGKIPDLIPHGALNADTRLVLTNAIYFKDQWSNPFSEKATKPAPFHLLKGGDISVPMMSQIKSFGYTQGDGYQAIELPYKGSGCSMVILLPDAKSFQTFESTLNASRVAAITEQLAHQRVDLAMPKFKFDARLSLAKMLSAMGMPLAFTDAADFSGMTGKRDLLISAVIHQAVIAVNEKETEAAAATGVVMGLTAIAPTQPVVMRIDHPFLFFIRDRQTGIILFLGRVMNPNE